MKDGKRFGLISATFFGFMICVTSVAPVRGQQPRRPRHNQPAELQAADPEIRQLLDDAYTEADDGKIEDALVKGKEALDIAKKRGFVADKAIVEAALASGYFVEGRLQEAFELLHQALQEAVDSSNLVLEADILASLSTEAQSKGNLPGALDILVKALDRAEKSKNLYIKSRVLGELARVQLLSGKLDEGRRSIDQALEIDRLNDYEFKAMHLVYQGYTNLASKEFDSAIQIFETARRDAIEKSDLVAFVLAENALASAYVQKGDPSKAISILESVRQGKLETGQFQSDTQVKLNAAIKRPFARVAFLESLGWAYEAGGKADSALAVWGELYGYSKTIGLLLAEAESALRMAELSRQLKKTEDAINSYSIAAGLYRSIQNEPMWTQTLISQAALLIQEKKGQAIIPVEEELLEIAKRKKLRGPEFLAYLVMAEIYQPSGDLENARSVLEKAQALIQPGPSDSEIDNKLVLEAYARLADIYRALENPTQELFAIMKAISTARHLKDENQERGLSGYLRQRFDELHVYDRVRKAITQGQLSDVLTYSEIIFLYEGSPKDWAADENWSRICNVPYQLVKEPGGPETLINILSKIGPLPTFSKLPILHALSGYFMVVNSRPDLLEHYALEADSVLKEFDQPDGVWKLRTACTLAIAYARQDKSNLAKGKAAECMAQAEKTNDKQSKDFANAANTLAQFAANDQGAARSSLNYFLASSPDNPDLHVQMGLALGSKKLYKEAVAEFISAIELDKRKGDENAVANAYVQMASALKSSDSPQDKKQRLKSLEAAQDLYHKAKNGSGEGLVQVELGNFYLDAGERKSAIKYFREAESIGEELHDLGLSARAALLTGIAYNGLRDYRNADEFHRKASNKYRELGDKSSEALGLLFSCQDLEAQRELDLSLKTCLEAEAAVPQSRNPRVEHDIHSTLGSIYETMGELDKAVVEFQRAVQMAEALGDPRSLASSHLALSYLYQLLGQWDDAIIRVNKALQFFQEAKDKEGEATAYAEMVNIYGDRTSGVKDFDKALQYYSAAERLGYGPRLNLDLVEIYLQTGRYSEAIKAAAEGIKTCIKERDKDCQAHGLLSLSEAERRSGDLKAARSSLMQAAGLVAKSSDFYLRGRLLYGEANQRRAEGRLGEAVELYKQLISLLEGLKGSGASRTQLALSENYAFIYDEMISTLSSMNASMPASERSDLASEAFVYAEANKARQFGDSWGRAFIREMRQTLPADVQEKERRLVSQRDQVRSKLTADLEITQNSTPVDPRTLMADLTAINKEIEVFVSGIRGAYPQYTAVAYPQRVTLDDIPLRKGETLVEFKLTDDSAFVWIVRNETGNRNETDGFYEVPKSRKWFTDRISILRGGLNSGQTKNIDWQLSEEIFNVLFPGRYAEDLQHSQSITFVPDDVLFLLPFELLSPGASKGNFVLLSAPTRYYPSAAALRLARTVSHTTNWQEDFLGLADPITSREDERYDLVRVLSTGGSSPSSAKKLPTSPPMSPADLERIKSRGFSLDRIQGTATEVKAIAALFQESNKSIEVRLGIDATKGKLLDTDLAKFRFLHFATHGILPVDTGIKEPSLVLSYDGIAEEHMLLSMSEILTLRISADSVVLSACNTGSGIVSRAEGVMSLGRSFLASGASSVTVSLWQVSDESTAIFMQHFYRNVLSGKRKDVALAEARQALFSTGKKDPFFWAPFILIGE